MKITSIEFARCVARVEDLPRDHLPQIAFAGRSNVGKSSLLNSLVNRLRLAYVSATPGKTQTINFYLINKKFYLVDLPGYGYAKSAKTLRQAWQGLIEQYLTASSNLRLLVVLVDVRHPLADLDLQLLEWAHAQDLSCLVVATKTDKLSNLQLQKQLKVLTAAEKRVAIGELIPYSAKTGSGKDALWRRLQGYLVGKEK